MADPAPDDWLFNGPAVSASAPAAPAPVTRSLLPPQSVPSLPNEPDVSLLARAAVAEGDQNNPGSWRNVAGVVLNRAAKTGKSVADVLSEPGQFEAYGNGHIQAVDPNGPAFKSALAAVQGVKAGDVPYDSFYQPEIVAQRGVKPPFDPAKGTKIGSQLFGNGYAGGAPAGLSDDELKAWLGLQAPAAATPAGQQKDASGQYTVGPDKVAPTRAQAAWFAAHQQDYNPHGAPGFDGLPYGLQAGGPLPQTPGAQYVDLDGVHHVVPGGAGKFITNALAGLGQGAVMDTAASLSRLTGGTAGMAFLPPEEQAQLLAAHPDMDFAAETRKGVAAQERNYAFQHAGDLSAQGGRFVGQALPATALAALVPEVEAPVILGTGGRLAAQGVTNAARGVAATAPGVGASPQPVGQQLATGALAGVLVPAVSGGVGKTARALTGYGRTVGPEVAALADAAQTKYGMQLRSGQVMGASGDKGAATADSNLLGSSPAVRDNNIAQRRQWMRGVTGTYGDPSGNVGEASLQAARDRIGGVMNDVASRNNIAPPAADALQTRVSQIIGDAQDVLGDDAKPLLTMAEKIGSVRNSNGISGQSYQALTNKGAPLDRLAQSNNSNVAHYAQQMRESLDDAMEASASPGDVRDFQNARWQYKNLMTVAKLAPKAQDTADGVISPALLSGAVSTNFKNRAFTGAGDLGELAKIGQVFMKQPADSFTPSRLVDLFGPLKTGAEAAGLVGGGLALAQRPEAALGAGVSALAGWGAKSAAQALKQNAIGGSASNIIKRSLPNAPRSAVGSAFSGLGKLARPVEIPLSALAGVRLPGALAPQGAQ